MKNKISNKLIYADAQIMAKLYPDTFIAPSITDLNKIKIGDFVKVCIEITNRKENEPESERFWVKVENIDGDKITGSVSNALIHLKLKFGQTISFEKRNVYSITK